MSNATIIFLLTLCIMILICIIVYQQFVFHNGTKAKIHEISSKLKELLDTDSDEKVTVFTDNKALIELATQINRMLEDRQKVKVEYIDGRLQDLRQIVPVRWAIIGKSECEKRFAGILPVHSHENTMFE